MSRSEDTAFARCALVALSLCCGLAVAKGEARDDPGDRGIIINVDNSYFFGHFTKEKMTREGVVAYADRYKGSRVTHIFWCPNAMRASFAAKSRDAIWEVGKQRIPEKNIFANRWPRNAKLLHDRGIDPYAVWIQRCRTIGISPWLSMRMNDVHDVGDLKNFMHSSFWVEHPEYWRVPGGKSWIDRALNYGIAEVREHAMAFVRELLERYDPDGIELDWMRFGYHFAPGKEKEGCRLLTEFTRNVRALTKEWSAKRGHPIRLAARTPAHPDAAIGLGMDGVTWAREGLIDMLVPTPFWTSCDFDIPVELWRARIGEAAEKLIIAPGQEHNIRGYPGSRHAVKNDLASMRGFAAAHLHRGADRIYTFNHFDYSSLFGGEPAWKEMIHAGLGMEVATSHPRRHIVTFHDTVPPGVSAGGQLPIKGPVGGTLKIYTGPVPQSGKIVFLAGLSKHEGFALATFDVALNGQACEPIDDDKDLRRYAGVARAVRFRCPRSALRQGYNAVKVVQTPGQREARIVWAEIQIDPQS